MDVAKHYKLIGFGAMDVTTHYKFIGSGDSHGGGLSTGLSDEA